MLFHVYGTGSSGARPPYVSPVVCGEPDVPIRETVARAGLDAVPREKLCPTCLAALDEPGSPIPFAALGLDRETVVRRLRAWREFAREQPWADDDPRRMILANARGAVLGERKPIPDGAADDLLAFGISTPSDDQIDVALAFGDGDLYPEPALRGFERRERLAADAAERLGRIRAVREEDR